MTIAALIAFVAAASSFGAGQADPQALDREVARFTGADIGAPGGAVRPVDRRLRLDACDGGLALDWRTPQRDTVIVRCTDPAGWRLFVPVMVSQTFRTGVSGTGALAVNRGDAISLAVTGSGFTVSRPAEALESGAVGSWIRVRPVTERGSAQQPVRGRIARPGLVVLPVG